MDYMSLGGFNYNVFVYRYIGWPGMYSASDVATVLANSLSQNLTAQSVEDFMKTSTTGSPRLRTHTQSRRCWGSELSRGSLGQSGTVWYAGFGNVLQGTSDIQEHTGLRHKVSETLWKDPERFSPYTKEEHNWRHVREVGRHSKASSGEQIYQGP